MLQVFRILGFGLVWQTSGLQMIRIASVCVIWQSCCCENVDMVFFWVAVSRILTVRVFVIRTRISVIKGGTWSGVGVIQSQRYILHEIDCNHSNS